MNTTPTDQAVAAAAAQLLPFPVTLAADMAGNWTLQIGLGTRGGQDDPPGRAGIDPEPHAHWWIDIDGGVRTIISDYTLEADVGDVAAWITATAREAGSPATINTDLIGDPS